MKVKLTGTMKILQGVRKMRKFDDYFEKQLKDENMVLKIEFIPKQNYRV